jgi:trehalose 6-phosphate synthase
MHRIRENPANRTLLLGVDRLDYTKGIPYRLLAFRDALFRYPQLRRKVTLVQVVVPSRTGVSKYRELRAQIKRLVGGINGRFARADWVPVHYASRLLTPEELLAFYRAADIALITPLKDGMNLIAKEYCAADVTNNGIVILSEVAGAASQLQMGALLVNPYHIQAVADAILQAYQMDSAENKARMKKVRQVVRKQNVFWWVNSFLKSAISQDLGSLPYVQNTFPSSTREPFLPRCLPNRPFTRGDERARFARTKQYGFVSCRLLTWG